MSIAANTPIHFIPNIGSRTARILHELGIHTASQLNNVPDSMLVELFGPSIRTVTRHIRVTPPIEERFVNEDVKSAATEYAANQKSFSKRLHAAMKLMHVL